MKIQLLHDSPMTTSAGGLIVIMGASLTVKVACATAVPTALDAVHLYTPAWDGCACLI